jgi:uncharacterized RDD family membrane protein YckC
MTSATLMHFTTNEKGVKAMDFQLKYRTFWPRFLAAIIDGLILMPIDWLYNYVYSSQSTRIAVEWAILSHSAPWIYSVFMHGYYGQTIGKMVAKIKVVDVSESPITLRQAFLRDCVTVGMTTAVLMLLLFEKLFGSEDLSPSVTALSMMLGITASLWSWAEIITMLTNKKRRAIHDFIAGTVVVRTQFLETTDVITKKSQIQSSYTELEVDRKSRGETDNFPR